MASSSVTAWMMSTGASGRTPIRLTPSAMRAVRCHGTVRVRALCSGRRIAKASTATWARLGAKWRVIASRTARGVPSVKP